MATKGKDSPFMTDSDQMQRMERLIFRALTSGTALNHSLDLMQELDYQYIDDMLQDYLSAVREEGN